MTQIQPVQLDGTGPFLLPACGGFLGLAAVPSAVPIQILLVTQDGKELRIPVEDYSLERLYRTLKGHFESKKPAD
ncbi:hypothetical protein [Ferrovibrio sp.]|uniref:hypothetical protein n=1 Tax=Ferrovibrio sp. TaxID=1917215 RepID=UPI001B5222A0|nr:hypothetical protein [Ferrovibrio sp.]MBP7065435.1 hypothetical protein [Ferrovibrio sp.]